MSATMYSRSRIRYIVMSMSLRLRAVWSRPASRRRRPSPAGARRRRRGPHTSRRNGVGRMSIGDGIQRVAQRPRIVTLRCRARRAYQVGTMDRHQRREEQCLGVLEVFVEYVRDYRIESHVSSISNTPKKSVVHASRFSLLDSCAGSGFVPRSITRRHFRRASVLAGELAVGRVRVDLEAPCARRLRSQPDVQAVQLFPPGDKQHDPVSGLY